MSDKPKVITKEEVVASMPIALRSNITDNIVDLLNKSSNDPIIMGNIKENFITYASVLTDGRYKMQDYLNAVKYVSFKLLDYTNNDAYVRTFPDRYNALIQRGATAKEISSYVAAYNKNKLVTAIFEQSLVEPWILNQHNVQKAIDVLVDVLDSPDASDYVKTIAADKLMTHLKKPDQAAKIDINISAAPATTKSVDKLNEALDRLANLELSSNLTAKEIAAHNVVDGEFEDVEQ